MMMTMEAVVVQQHVLCCRRLIKLEQRRCYHDDNNDNNSNMDNSINNNNNSHNSAFMDPQLLSQWKHGQHNNNNKRNQRRNNKSKRTKTTTSNKPSYRFVDRTRLCATGGRGGKGSLSMEKVTRSSYKYRPNGGHGGDGGSVVIAADPEQQTLDGSSSSSSSHVQADNGTNGGSQNMFGRKGKNKIVRVPMGVVVKRVLEYNEKWDHEKQCIVRWNGCAWSEEYNDDDDDDESVSEEDDDHDHDESVYEEKENGDGIDGGESDNDEDTTDLEELHPMEEYNEFEDDNDENEYNYSSSSERETVVLADLDKAGSYVVVARGGRGGYGSCLYAKNHGGMPDAYALTRNAQPKPGEVVHLELELKLIADLGLVGFPNAGKSSLLRAMSRATPAVAPYPFTTLHPLVGCVEYRDGLQIKMADIPGLIDGAGQGRGKGIDFLRHIERTKALLYIVDAAGVDYRDPARDLQVLAQEMSSYGDGSLMERRALVVANKIDLIPPEQLPEILHEIEELACSLGILDHPEDEGVLGISAGVTGDGLAKLSKAIREVVTQRDQERSLALSTDATSFER